MKKVLQNKTKTRFISSVLLASILTSLILPASSAWAQTTPVINDYTTDVFDNGVSGIQKDSIIPTDWRKDIGASTFNYKASLKFSPNFDGVKDGWKFVFTKQVSFWVAGRGLFYGPHQDEASFVVRVYESDAQKNPIGDNTVVFAPPQDPNSSYSDKNIYLENKYSFVSGFFKYLYGDTDYKTISAENIESQTVKLPKTIKPGNYVSMDLFYCGQKDASNESVIAGLFSGLVLGQQAVFMDKAYGDVVHDGDNKGLGINFKEIKNASSDPCTSQHTGDHRTRKAVITGVVAGIPKYSSFSPETVEKNVQGLYFKIGETQTTQIPLDVTHLQDQLNKDSAVTGITNQTADKSSTDILPSCSLSGGILGKGTFMGCIALFIYYIVFWPASGFAWLMGQIFDFFLGYSISSIAYDQPFIESMWGTLRDIANIFFIILMIYVALMAVFEGGGNYKKVVGSIIVNALLINFSLFFTRVVIDASNITARLFYAQIVINDNKTTQDLGVGTSGYKQVSAAIISTFNPQKIFQNAFNSAAKPNTGATKEAVTSNSSNQSVNTFDTSNTTKSIEHMYSNDPEKYAGYFALVSLFAALISFATGIIFWSIAFIFIGRVIGLYIAMMFSPFAFMSRDIPMLKKLEGLSWDGWVGDLTNYAISAPLAVAYLFLVNQISQVPVFANKGGDGSFFTDILWISIPMLIIYSLMDKGKKLIMKYAGDIGTMVQGYANKVGGLAAGVGVGVATGGLAVAGRNSIGRLAKFAQGDPTTGRSTLLSNWVDRNQGKNNFVGRLARGTAKTVSGAQKASFDARQSETFSAGLGALSGKMGIKVNTDNFATRALGVSKDSLKGGYKEFDKRKQEEVTKDINSITTNAKDGKEAQAIWEQATATYFEKNKKSFAADVNKDYAKNTKKAFAADMRLLDPALKEKKDEEIIGTKTEAEIIQERDTKMQEILKARSDKEVSSFGDVVDNATLTQATRQLYAKNIQRSPTQWGKLAQNLGIDGYTSGILGTTGLGAFLGGGALTGGAGLVAAGIGSTSYLESESRVVGAGKDLKDRQKIIDRQRDVSDNINELIKKIREETEFYDEEAVAKMDKALADAKDIPYNMADKDLEYIQNHYTNILNEKLQDLQATKKSYKNKKGITDEVKQQNRKDILRNQREKDKFSKIKSTKEAIKKEMEEKSKPKDEKSK